MNHEIWTKKIWNEFKKKKYFLIKFIIVYSLMLCLTLKNQWIVDVKFEWNENTINSKNQQIKFKENNQMEEIL